MLDKDIAETAAFNERTAEFGFFNEDCMIGLKRYPDKFFDLALVDPVYGDITSGSYTNTKYDNTSYFVGNGKSYQKAYNRAIWKQPKTPPEYFEELFRVSKDQVIWGANFFVENLPSSQGWIVWDKKHPEGIKYSDCEIAFTSFNVGIRMFRYTWNGMLQENMKNKEKRIHPTQKPVALYEWILNKYAKPGDIILDTHVGSGSSLIACRNTNHKYVGFEIDPDYYRLAKERIDRETAQMNIWDFIGDTNGKVD